MRSNVQSSVYCRIGEEPMNVAASILIPTSSETRTIGSISAMTIRDNQLPIAPNCAARTVIADDRLDIGDDGPGGAIGGDGKLVVADLFGERPHLIDDARTGARQADIGGYDAEVRHQVQQPLFDVERRVRDRRRLQAIAQRLVIQINPGARPIEAAVYARAVPVVDKLALLHAISV